MSREALEKAWQLMLKSKYLPCGECKQVLGPNDICPKEGMMHTAGKCEYWHNTQNAGRLSTGYGDGPFAYSSIDGANEFQQYSPARDE
jgi:hypothetical protein|tara:strand:- start:284 stop:547 length:264 start_codon:yes stop_codon:yes gene_type:complete